jgi:CubicO group peptidase (beta-lactamase class C family)
VVVVVVVIVPEASHREGLSAREQHGSNRAGMFWLRPESCIVIVEITRGFRARLDPRDNMSEGNRARWLALESGDDAPADSNMRSQPRRAATRGSRRRPIVDAGHKPACAGVPMNALSSIAEIIDEAIDRRGFPAATIEVGRAGGTLWRHAAGRLTYDRDAAPTRDDTIFDLASLTKVVATASLAMRAVDDGRLDLDSRVAEHFVEWRGDDRAMATVRDLLTHSAGLTAYLPFFRDHTGRREFERAICTLPLEYEPRARSIYSDLGFILLAFLLEDVHSSRRPFAGAAGSADPAATFQSQFSRLASLLTPEPLTFNPPREWRPVTAPTEVDAWRGRLLVGEVHDENAWALGGAAGHAGLFGTATAVGAFARAVLRTIAGEPIVATASTMREFITRGDVPNSSRALGWDTMLPTSSCGRRLSPTSIGHTGFTGTSLWIDWERDLYVVLLTNRVHPTRDARGIKEVRRAVHDAICGAL